MIDPLTLIPFVRNCCLKARVPPQLREDAEQEGLLALLQHLPRFDESRGVPVEGFLYPHVMGAIVRLLKRENLFVSRFKQSDHSGMDNRVLYEIKPSVYSATRPSDFDDSLLQYLEGKEREAIDLHYYRGLDAGQIATEMGLTRRRVRQLLQSGIETLRLLSEHSISDSGG